MQWKQLASALAKSEGKKSQVKIGDVREILARLVDIQKECIKTDDTPGPCDLIAVRAGLKLSPQLIAEAKKLTSVMEKVLKKVVKK